MTDRYNAGRDEGVTQLIENAAREEFAADLSGMSDSDIDDAISETSDLVDRETSWLEALTAEKRVRANAT
jgi:hypothetical protein